MAETVGVALQRLRGRFASAGIDTAALDARLLVQHVLGLDHAGLITGQDRVLSGAELDRLAACESRRLRGEPYARIVGVREFYGRNFAVDGPVLDPRPDTESLIDLCLNLIPRERALRFADLGAGSGAIAVTLLAEYLLARGVAVDVSHEALDVVRRNALAHGVADRLEIVHSNWFETVGGRFDLIISNPPYIRSGDIAGLACEVREHDPLLALDGGEDGLFCYRAIAGQSGVHLAEGGIVVVEAGQGQADDIKYIFRDTGFMPAGEATDLSGITRALAFSKV